MPKPTMRDVAQHAGVSIATVSHVINNTRFVSEETRRRVNNSIAKLEYSPDATARSFKTGRKNLVAFIIPDIANAFFATLIEEVERVLSKGGYKLIVINTKETKSREMDNLRVLSNGVVDGFIIASTMDDFNELPKVPDDIPLVFVDRKLPNCPCDLVLVDNYNAMYQGVEFLINKGYEKIGYITGLPRISTTQERLRAYKTAMADHGLSSENLIRLGDSMSQSVAGNLSSLLDAGCNALVVANNIMATEAMMQMLVQGIRPGSDIEMLGYRDSGQAQYGLQHMHLICQPTEEMGHAAGKQMLERLQDINAPIKQINLKALFTPRNK